MKKRIFSMILAAVFCLSMVPAAVSADGPDGPYTITSNVEGGEITYTILVRGLLTNFDNTDLPNAGDTVQLSWAVDPLISMGNLNCNTFDYKLYNLTITDEYGDHVSYSSDFKFIMPASNVTVTGIISDTDPNNNGVPVMVFTDGPGTLVTSPEQGVTQGLFVSVTPQPQPGAELVYYSVKDGDGAEVTTYPGSNGVFSFLQPAGGSRVYGIFRLSEERTSREYDITCYVEGGSIYPRISNDTSRVGAKAGETVELQWIQTNFSDLNSEYFLRSLTVTDVFGNPVETNDAAFIMPHSDVTVRAVIAQLLPFNVYFNVEGGTMSYNYSGIGFEDGPWGGETISLNWGPPNYNELELDAYYLADVVVKDEKGHIIPLSANNTFIMPASDVFVSAVIRHRSNFGETYRVTLSPGRGGGTPIVYEANDGNTTVGVHDYDFIYDTFSASPGFYLTDSACPASFTPPGNLYVFDGWEGPGYTGLGPNYLTSTETTYTAKWKLDDTIPDASFHYTFAPLTYRGNALATMNVTLDDGAFGIAMIDGCAYRAEQTQIVFNSNGSVRKGNVRVSIYNENSRVYFDSIGDSGEAAYWVPTSILDRPGKYTGLIQAEKHVTYAGLGDRTETFNIPVVFYVTGYELDRRAWTLTESGCTEIPCTLTSYWPGSVPINDGNGTFVPTTGVRFEWDDGVLENDSGDMIDFKVSSYTYSNPTTTGSSGYLNAQGAEFGIPIWIDPDDYNNAAEGTYNGTLHYRSYWQTEESGEYAGEEGSITIGLEVHDNRIYYDLGGDYVSFTNERGEAITKAPEGKTVLAQLVENDIPENYGYGGSFLADDANLTLQYIGEGFYSFTMPDHSVNVSARIEPYVLGTPTYTIHFMNEDGTELQSVTVDEGVTPVYTGATPVKAADAGYTYTFAGWSKEIAPASADAWYYATFTSTVREYRVIFRDENGAVLSNETVAYGELPAAPALPTKPESAQYTYTFAGWSPTVTHVTDQATYTATYTASPREYMIWFIDEDGSVLQSGTVGYGSVPSYTGTAPTKDASGLYTYTFSGWTPALSAVTGDAVYRAAYTATGIPLAVSAAAYPSAGGSVSGAGTLEAATSVTVTAAPNLGYAFVNWTEDGEVVSTDASYTFTLLEERDLTANFGPAYTVTLLPGTADNTAIPGDPVVITSIDGGVWGNNADDVENGQFYVAAGGDGMVWFLYPDCPYTAPEGYIFTGWRLEGNTFNYGAGSRWHIGPNDVATAQWTREYDITAQPMANAFAAWDELPASAFGGTQIYATVSLTDAAYEDGWRLSKLVLTSGSASTEITTDGDGYAIADMTPSGSEGRRYYTLPFDMPDSDVTVSAVFSPAYALSSENVFFYNTDFDQIDKAAAGQTVYACTDYDTIEDGYYFAGSYLCDDAQIDVDEAGDGIFTMPAKAVTVSAVFAEQENYAISLPDDTPVALPEDLAGYLTGAEEFMYDDDLGVGVFDLNDDGVSDVMFDFDDYTLCRLPGADDLADGITLSVFSMGRCRYNSVTFSFSAQQTPILWGDVSGDGSITGMDASLILQYAANYDDDTGTSSVLIPNAEAADVNGDGNITVIDASLILQYVANFDEETGTSTVVLGPQD